MEDILHLVGQSWRKSFLNSIITSKFHKYFQVVHIGTGDPTYGPHLLCVWQLPGGDARVEKHWIQLIFKRALQSGPAKNQHPPAALAQHLYLVILVSYTSFQGGREGHG